MTTIPTWYYKRANLPLSDQIIKEFQDALPILLKSLGHRERNYNQLSNIDLVKELVPSLSITLKEMNLYDKWHRVSLVGAWPSMPLPIHRDGSSTKIREYALNFPIYGCEYSETSFYEQKKEYSDLGDINHQRVNLSGAVFLEPNSQMEKQLEKVDSVIVSEPTWLKTGAYHSVTSTKARMAASVRFEPEPFDYLNTL
jgi:hypothetical protein